MKYTYDYLANHVEITMGQSPKSEYYNTEKKGLPFLQGNRTFGEKYPYFDTYCTDFKKVAEPGDILLSVRAPVGDVNIANEKICIGRGICSLRMKNGNNEFLYYLLRAFKKYITNQESGTVFGSINKKQIENLFLPFPPEIIQKKIANILKSLDDKIEMNNKINKTLEQIAQTIFKHWFVDFEFPNEEGKPYKSNGGKFVESELGMIPEGWRVSTLQEVCNIKYGKNLPTKKLLKKGYPVYGGNGVIGFYDEYLYEEPQVIVACRGAASGKVLNTVPYSFVTNNSLVLELKSSIINYEYLKFYCSYYSFYQYTTGSAQPQLTIQNIKDFSILVPKKNILNRFHQIIKPIEEIIYQLSVQSEHLAQLRDTLLPKLMSGEIRVPEAEKVVESNV